MCACFLKQIDGWLFFGRVSHCQNKRSTTTNNSNYYNFSGVIVSTTSLVFYDKYIFTLFVTINLNSKLINLKSRSFYFTCWNSSTKVIKAWSSLKPLLSSFIPQPCKSWHFVIIHKTLLQMQNCHGLTT